MNRKQSLATHLTLLAMLSPGAVVLAQEQATPPPTQTTPAEPANPQPAMPPETPPQTTPETPQTPPPPDTTAPKDPAAMPDSATGTPQSKGKMKGKHHKPTTTNGQQDQTTPDQTTPQQ